MIERQWISCPNLVAIRVIDSVVLQAALYKLTLVQVLHHRAVTANNESISCKINRLHAVNRHIRSALGHNAEPAFMRAGCGRMVLPRIIMRTLIAFIGASPQRDIVNAIADVEQLVPFLAVRLLLENGIHRECKGHIGYHINAGVLID
ncbi:hypothetical protein D3C78_1276650 [compost metagenome]